MFSPITPLDDGPIGLLERSMQIETIRRACGSALAGAGRVLLVEGAAGIGKSALLDTGAGLAGELGMQVLRARGSELEQDFGFGVAGQLFGRAVRAEPGLLAGGAALAAPALKLQSKGLDSSEALYAVLQGLYWLTVDLAERAPVALLVDDAQWSDRASMRFLSHLAHRIDEIGVLVLAAARPAPGGAASVRSLRDVERLELEPLSLPATAELVRSLAPEATDEIAQACYVATGGNAFYVHALASALDGDARANASVGDWSPAAISRGVSHRLETMVSEARRLARAVSVLAPGAPLGRVAALAGLNMSSATAAVDDLVAADLLAARGGLEFVHPIVRAAVHDDLGPGERARLHRHAARLLSEDGEPAERVAVHLLHCERAGESWSVGVLHAAARQALGRGAPEAAMTYLQRALDEPANAEDQVALLVDLAEVQTLSFEPRAAEAHLLQAHEGARDREQRLDIASRLAVLHSHGAGTAPGIELLARTRQDFAEDPETVLRIEARMANVGRGYLSGRELSFPVIERLRQAAESPDDPEVLAAAAAELVMVAEPAERVRAIARKALARAEGAIEPSAALAQLVAIRVLITVEDLDVAAAALTGALEASRSRGSELSYVFAAVFYADLLLRRGELLSAEAEAHAAYTVAAEHGWPGGLPWLVASMLEVMVQRGHLEEAEVLLAEADMLAPAAELAEPYTSNVLLAARGRLRAAQGRPIAALADLRECGRRQQAWGEVNPALVAWRSLAAKVLCELGELDEARGLALEELTLARQFAAPRALGIALRAAARVSDGAEGDALAEEACEVLASSAARLEHAHALADLAQRHLAHGNRQGSRDLLTKALELADRCDADVLEDRVRAQLRLVGARPRRAQRSGPRSLTPSERQIALLAARGKPNRQIAEELFVTQRTVEFHLGNAFRKLGITSRRELPDVLTGMLP